MERKIGEIFEFGGEWYQCVEDSLNRCVNCCFFNGGYKECSDELGECSKGCRGDETSVIFKKLEKVGEMYEKRVSDGTSSTFQRYRVYNSVILPKEPYIYCNFIDSTVEIEIKQTKEDMEEKKLNLKPFDIQKAREGKPVCTRDGRKARIICFDVKGAMYPIIALIEESEGEKLCSYMPNGRSYKNEKECIDDLMMLPEKKEGWAKIRKDINLYDTKEEADRKMIGNDEYVTAKVCWEE